MRETTPFSDFPSDGGLSASARLTLAFELDRDQSEGDPDPLAVVRDAKLVLGRVLGATCAQPYIFISSVA